MPVNRNALIRYKTIDQCLQNRYRDWTLQNLIDACTDALYEYEGIDKPISRRTIQADIQIMRSDKLGYNAPIIVVDRKNYIYSNPEFTIENTPLSKQDLNSLSEAVDVLKQLKGFTHFKELSGIVQRLEDKVFIEQNKRAPIIDIEKNENLRGLDFLDKLYDAIVGEQVIDLVYKSFKARSSQAFVFTPYLLKEYRNRWFVLGKIKTESALLTLALDRIEGIKLNAEELYFIDPVFDQTTYYKDVIGVTVRRNQKVETIHLWVNSFNAPYVLTKPLHHSQKVIERNSLGVTLVIKVALNYELEREILGFGEGMKVLKPQKLVRRIRNNIKKAEEAYRK